MGHLATLVEPRRTEQLLPNNPGEAYDKLQTYDSLNRNTDMEPSAPCTLAQLFRSICTAAPAAALMPQAKRKRAFLQLIKITLLPP